MDRPYIACSVLFISIASLYGLLIAAQPADKKDNTAPAVNEQRDARYAAPAPRKKSDVEAVLQATPETNRGELPTVNILLLASKKDHGPGEHDYPAWQAAWKPLLSKLPRVKIDTAYGWPNELQWKEADLVVCYYWNHEWSPAQYRDLDAFLDRGGGIVLIHAATIADRAAEHLAERMGLAYEPAKIKFRHGPLDLKIEADENEPITRGLPRAMHFHDESYWLATGDPKKVRVLATTVEEDVARPMLWTYEVGKNENRRGRVFGSIMGHYMWTFDDPFFRIMILRGMAWAARQPEDRFISAATDGIRFDPE
jgi:type 1 glutamine amidotransferase